jgi:hypothetical protein
LTFVAEQPSALPRWVAIAGIREPASIEIDAAGTKAKPDDSQWFADGGVLLLRLGAADRQCVTVTFGG